MERKTEWNRKSGKGEERARRLPVLGALPVYLRRAIVRRAMTWWDEQCIRAAIGNRFIAARAIAMRRARGTENAVEQEEREGREESPPPSRP